MSYHIKARVRDVVERVSARALAQYRALRRRLLRVPPPRFGPQSRMPADARSKVFGHAYKTRAWTSTGESLSGDGSSLAYTSELRRALPDMLKDLGVRTLLDIPCGDWNWMSQVDLPVEKYIGGDLVPNVVAANQARFGNAQVEFRVFDLCADPLPPADFLLCRDALVHFSLADTWDAIDNILNAEIRLFASTTFPETSENIDIETGIHWRPLNLEAPPFSFPPCLRSLREGSSERQLSVWLVSDIRETIPTTFDPLRDLSLPPAVGPGPSGKHDALERSGHRSSG